MMAIFDSITDPISYEDEPYDFSHKTARLFVLLAEAIDIVAKEGVSGKDILMLNAQEIFFGLTGHWATFKDSSKPKKKKAKELKEGWIIVAPAEDSGRDDDAYFSQEGEGIWWTYEIDEAKKYTSEIIAERHLCSALEDDEEFIECKPGTCLAPRVKKWSKTQGIH
jgi:hypothetical protein